jgi:hypothetical protein
MGRERGAIGGAVFFVMAPGVVVSLVPWLMTGRQVRDPLPGRGALRAVGLVLLVAGVIGYVLGSSRIALEGLGTPAPVAAPERLVVGGLYPGWWPRTRR